MNLDQDQTQLQSYSITLAYTRAGETAVRTFVTRVTIDTTTEDADDALGAALDNLNDHDDNVDVIHGWDEVAL